MKILLICILVFLFWKDVVSQEGINAAEFKDHIGFLASDQLEGRYPGTKGNLLAQKYIASCFKKFRLKKFDKKFYQEFEAVRRQDSAKINTANIVGYIEGNDPILKYEFIVLGAHYDHLGWGGKNTGSKNKDTVAIHNGADDNASGTSALLEIAQELSSNRKLLKRSVIIIAFGAEEFGLQGSKYFVEHLPVKKDAIKVMINMDMVGRLNSENHLYMGGAGTFPGGVELMKEQGEGSGLNLIVHAGGVGGSDHVSFYKNGISAIGMHTGGHPEYHLPSDDLELINHLGAELVSRYIYKVILSLSQRQEAFGFIQRND